MLLPPAGGLAAVFVDSIVGAAVSLPLLPLAATGANPDVDEPAAAAAAGGAVAGGGLALVAFGTARLFCIALIKACALALAAATCACILFPPADPPFCDPVACATGGATPRL